MSKLLSIMSVLSFIFSTGAYAYGQQELSFEQLKQSCRTPGEFHNQNPPSNIVVTCEHFEQNWVPVESSENALGTFRDVVGSIRSNKYTVGRASDELGIPETVFSCPQFKEVERTLVVERSVSCSEILSFEGDLPDLCAGIIDEALAQNPGAVTEVDTGSLISSCGLIEGELDVGQDDPSQDEPTQDEVGQGDYGQENGQDA